MASLCKVLLLFVFLISSLHFLSVMCAEFEVGGGKGWVVPSSKNDQLYNEWASKNRFNIGDTLRFGYKKDSVLVVTDEEYDKCKSSHPVFFSNNGDTMFKLDRPGLFYFISGVSGHCERGLQMIIKVLEPETPPAPASSNQTSGVAAVEVAGTITTNTTVVMLLMTMAFFGAVLLM